MLENLDWRLIATTALAPLIGYLGMYAGGFWSVGCGWLVVPSALLFFHCTPMQAAGIGLLQMAPSIVFTALKDAPKVGWERGGVGRSLVLPSALGAFLTSFVGRPVNVYFNALCGRKALLAFFAVFMLLVGYETLFGRGRNYSESTPTPYSRRSSVWAFFGGLGAGVFSSVLGVGGAMVFRPIFASGFKVSELDTGRAVRLLLLTTTTVGGFAYLFSGDGFDPKILFLSLAIAAGGAVGFPHGAKLHENAVSAGFAQETRRSFAIICGIVILNSVLNLCGLERLSQYLMLVAAGSLFILLRVFARRARKRLENSAPRA